MSIESIRMDRDGQIIATDDTGAEMCPIHTLNGNPIVEDDRELPGGGTLIRLQDFAASSTQPAGADQEAAVRHVRDAMMTANAAIALGPPNWILPLQPES